MKNVVFDAPENLWLKGRDNSQCKVSNIDNRPWSFGTEIIHVLACNFDHIGGFEIEICDRQLDYLAIRRLAETSIFQRWRNARG